MIIERETLRQRIEIKKCTDFSLFSRSDSYALTNFTNKDKKKLKDASRNGQRKTQKRKKGEEDAENSENGTGSFNYYFSISSSAYTSLSQNDINSDSSSSRDCTLLLSV